MYGKFRLSPDKTTSSASPAVRSPMTADSCPSVSRVSGLLTGGWSDGTHTTSPSEKNNVLVVDGNRGLHSRWVFLEYSQCSLSSNDEFECAFSAMLKRNGCKDATFYGCEQRSDDGAVHYSVLLKLGVQPHWVLKTASHYFAIGDNQHPLTIRGSRQRCASQFIEDCVMYWEAGDCFGEDPRLSRPSQ